MTIVKKNKIKWTLVVTSFILSIIMFASFVIGLFVPTENERCLDRFDFKYGTVATDLNDISDSRTTIISKKIYKTGNLDIEVLDSSVEVYLVFCEYYDNYRVRITEDNTVESAVEEFSKENGSFVTSETRIEIKLSKVDGEYPKLNVFNIGKIFDSVVIKGQ